MKSLAEQMAVYQAYHTHPKNKLTHFFGVPMIIYSLLVVLSLIQLEMSGVTVTAAMIFVGFVWIYYLILDIPLALFLALAIGALLYGAHETALMGNTFAWIAFAVTFVLGWIIQLVGHAIEKRKPALLDNLFQIFIAPLFLGAEVFFMLGLYQDIQADVVEGSQQYMPKSE